MSGQTEEQGNETQDVADVRPLPEPDDRPEFIRVGEAAKAIGVSPMTVRRLYDARKLPGQTINRTRLILRVFVDGYVAEIKAGLQPVLEDYAKDWFQQAAEEMAS